MTDAGRFIQRDPFPGVLTAPLTLHRSSYVGNNPVNQTDPSGLTSFRVGRSWEMNLGGSRVLKEDERRYEDECRQDHGRGGTVVNPGCLVYIFNIQAWVPVWTPGGPLLLPAVAPFGGSPGTPGGGGQGEDRPLRQFFKSKRDAPNWPAGFRQTVLRKVKFNDRGLLTRLREKEPSDWKKVYEDRYAADGSKVSVHYFQSGSGMAFDMKVRSGWSNR